MTATLDANVLLYASDETSDVHRQAVEFVRGLGQTEELFYLFWPTVMAYLRVATHPSIFDAPLPPAEAMANVESLLALSNVQTAGEPERFWQEYRRVADDAEARGNLVPDAHLVALMVTHGVRTLWTRDRDYRRFPGIEARDPFG